MSAFTIRLPEEKRTRLKLVAKSRKVIVTRLIEEMANILLADFDAETRFELRAARGRGRIKEGSRYWTRRTAGAAARSKLEWQGRHRMLSYGRTPKTCHGIKAQRSRKAQNWR
jgi:hypothetical protein